MKRLSFSVSLAAMLLGAACATSPPDARTPQDAAATDSEGRHEPSSKKEKALAKRIATLKAGESVRVGDVRVSASEKYFAASGYECRRAFLESDGQQEVRLVCGEESGWFFVPNVSGGGELPKTHAAQPEDASADVELSPTGEARAVSAPSNAAPSSAAPSGAPESKGSDSATAEETREKP